MRTEEEKKKKILWISVVVISATIFIFWVYSFSNYAQNILRNKQKDSLINISEIKKGVDDINDELIKTKEIISSTIKEKSSLENNPETIRQEIEENLKKQLEQATSTDMMQ